MVAQFSPSSCADAETPLVMTTSVAISIAETHASELSAKNAGGQMKISGSEDALQSFPVNWRELGHGRSSRHWRGMFFDADPVRAAPQCAVVFVTGVFQHFGQRAMLFR